MSILFCVWLLFVPVKSQINKQRVETREIRTQKFKVFTRGEAGSKEAGAMISNIFPMKRPCLISTSFRALVKDGRENTATSLCSHKNGKETLQFCFSLSKTIMSLGGEGTNTHTSFYCFIQTAFREVATRYEIEMNNRNF